MLTIISIMTTSTIVTGCSLAYSLELAQRSGHGACEAQGTGELKSQGRLETSSRTIWRGPFSLTRRLWN